MKVISGIGFLLAWGCATVVVALLVMSFIGGLLMFLWMGNTYGYPETSKLVLLSIFCAIVGLAWAASDWDKKTNNSSQEKENA